MSCIDDAVITTTEGVILSLEVSAGSREHRFPAGYNPWRKAIHCKVSDPPREGKANAAVLTLIAEVLKVPVSSLRIQCGATSSMKKILVTGKTRSDIIQRLSDISG